MSTNFDLTRIIANGSDPNALSYRVSIPFNKPWHLELGILMKQIRHITTESLLVSR